jgi:hypothetical protein
MVQQEANQIYSTRDAIPSEDMDTSVEIIKVSVRREETTLHDAKECIRKVRSFVNDEVFIPRTYSEYDCTGRPSTSSIDLISKLYTRGWIHYIYLHHISFDV